MKTTLTPFLLKFLFDQGYHYLLSKTANIDHSNASVQITLTPVVEKPVLRKLPRDFDTYFKLAKEAMIMARGIDDTLILVNLSVDDVARLKEMALDRKNDQARRYA